MQLCSATLRRRTSHPTSPLRRQEEQTVISPLTASPPPGFALTSPGQLRNHARCSLIPLHRTTYSSPLPPLELESSREGCTFRELPGFIFFPPLSPSPSPSLFFFFNHFIIARVHIWDPAGLIANTVSGTGWWTGSSLAGQAAMELLKFCFVFLCCFKFARSLSSAGVPQAPAPIPKGTLDSLQTPTPSSLSVCFTLTRDTHFYNGALI